MARPRNARRFGFLLKGRKLWLSELLSLFIVIMIAAAFFLLTGRIVSNETAIYRNTGRLGRLQADNVLLTHQEKGLRDRVAIAELLCSIAGNRIDPDVLLELSGIVYKNSNKFGYDPLLLLSVIEVESVYNPEARGKYRSGKHSGALGLMQIKPATAREIAIQLGMQDLADKDLFKPEVNVILGVAYLTTMIERFNSFKLGILAYNQGPGVISKQLSENTELSVQYYQKVLKAYYRLKNNAMQLAAAESTEPVCR
jgi:hypothetical protein